MSKHIIDFFSVFSSQAADEKNDPDQNQVSAGCRFIVQIRQEDYLSFWKEFKSIINAEIDKIEPANQSADEKTDVNFNAILFNMDDLTITADSIGNSRSFCCLENQNDQRFLISPSHLKSSKHQSYDYPIALNPDFSRSLIDASLVLADDLSNFNLSKIFFASKDFNPVLEAFSRQGTSQDKTYPSSLFSQILSFSAEKQQGNDDIVGFAPIHNTGTLSKSLDDYLKAKDKSTCLADTMMNAVHNYNVSNDIKYNTAIAEIDIEKLLEFRRSLAVQARPSFLLTFFCDAKGKNAELIKKSLNKAVDKFTLESDRTVTQSLDEKSIDTGKIISAAELFKIIQSCLSEIMPDHKDYDVSNLQGFLSFYKNLLGQLSESNDAIKKEIVEPLQSPDRLTQIKRLENEYRASFNTFKRLSKTTYPLKYAKQLFEQGAAALESKKLGTADPKSEKPIKISTDDPASKKSKEAPELDLITAATDLIDKKNKLEELVNLNEPIKNSALKKKFDHLVFVRVNVLNIILDKCNKADPKCMADPILSSMLSGIITAESSSIFARIDRDLILHLNKLIPPSAKPHTATDAGSKESKSIAADRPLIDRINTIISFFKYGAQKVIGEISSTDNLHDSSVNIERLKKIVEDNFICEADNISKEPLSSGLDFFESFALELSKDKNASAKYGLLINTILSKVFAISFTHIKDIDVDASDVPNDHLVLTFDDASFANKNFMTRDTNEHQILKRLAQNMQDVKLVDYGQQLQNILDENVDDFPSAHPDPQSLESSKKRPCLDL